MRKVVQFITLLLLVGFVNGQEISKKLQEAVIKLEADDQLQNGMVGLYVINQKDGTEVFNRNGTTGMPVASCQKVLTSVAALELLGGDFRYNTSLEYNGKIADGILNGNLYLDSYGDPTLGSWRYNNTKEEVILHDWITAIKQAGIHEINGKIIINNNNWSTQTIPGGWIWDDIGNYYGAGANVINWHENQYDLKLKSGSAVGDKVNIVSIQPPLFNVELINELETGKAGSGDNSYIYLPPYANTGYVRGTIPPNENSFTVSGSLPDPSKQVINLLTLELQKAGIKVNNSGKFDRSGATTALTNHQSPSLDSMNYWFLRKSINLYGEALAKTLGYQQKKEGSTEAGIAVIKNFWKERGIETTAINMKDGSGLSPQNRITPKALVTVMQYARSKAYFNSFYNALPEFDGIKMKSGTIGGVKSFTGYVNGYTFAIVINNYNGATSAIVGKMYKLLGLLK